MDALEKLDLLEEHADLVTQLQGGSIDALDKLDMLERLAEIIALLGGSATDAPSQGDAPQTPLATTEPTPAPEPTELESLLKDLQEQHIQPDDIDLDHLAELAGNSSEDETLNQIRNILDMELVAKWLQQLDEMAA